MQGVVKLLEHPTPLQALGTEMASAVGVKQVPQNLLTVPIS